MQYERTGLLLPEPCHDQVDQGLASSFVNLHEGKAATYKLLEPVGEAKDVIAEEFQAGMSPNLTAGQLDQEALDQQLADLKSWKKMLLESDADPEVVQAYRWRINEDIANVHMLRASARGDMRSFKRWNEFIYGKPNKEIYHGALDWFRRDAVEILTNPDSSEELSAAAMAVTELIDSVPNRESDKSAIIPDATNFEAVRQNHIQAGGYYALLLSGVEVPEKGSITPDQGVPILSHVVSQNLESDYQPEAVSGTVWSVSHDRKTVNHPEVFRMPVKRFVGLGLGHEIGSHLLEMTNGKRGPLGLASIGLDRYEAGNEGRAVIREQVVYETFDEFSKLVRWQDILRRHVAISYASGVGEDSPHEASEVYKFMNTIDRMYQLKLLKPDAEPSDAYEKADTKTTALLTRVLKGTDGKGGAYLKDKVYLEGNIACWNQSPEAIYNGDLGKFDITNPRHITLLQKLGLLPNNE